MVVNDVIYHYRCDKDSIKMLEQKLSEVDDYNFYSNFSNLFNKLIEKSKNNRKSIF